MLGLPQNFSDRALLSLHPHLLAEERNEDRCCSIKYYDLPRGASIITLFQKIFVSHCKKPARRLCLNSAQLEFRNTTQVYIFLFIIPSLVSTEVSFFGSLDIKLSPDLHQQSSLRKLVNRTSISMSAQSGA